MNTEITPGDFPFISTDKLRYSDTDRQGHVNNAVYATFFETGRVEFIASAATPITGQDCEFVLARIAVDYLREIHWPGEVRIGSRISRVGRTSLTVEQGLFIDERLHARAESVMVQINTRTRRPEPISDQARDLISADD